MVEWFGPGPKMRKLGPDQDKEMGNLGPDQDQGNFKNHGPSRIGLAVLVSLDTALIS